MKNSIQTQENANRKSIIEYIIIIFDILLCIAFTLLTCFVLNNGSVLFKNVFLSLAIQTGTVIYCVRAWERLIRGICGKIDEDDNNREDDGESEDTVVIADDDEVVPHVPESED